MLYFAYSFISDHITIDNYYYFDDIVRLEDFVIDNVLIDKKLHENILVCGI